MEAVGVNKPMVTWAVVIEGMWRQVPALFGKPDFKDYNINPDAGSVGQRTRFTTSTFS